MDDCVVFVNAEVNGYQYGDIEFIPKKHLELERSPGMILAYVVRTMQERMVREGVPISALRWEAMEQW